MERLGRPKDDITERQVLSVRPITCYPHLSIHRYTKPLPQNLVRLAEEDLFGGDVTEEEGEEKHRCMPPYPVSGD